MREDIVDKQCLGAENERKHKEWEKPVYSWIRKWVQRRSVETEDIFLI